MLATEDIQKLAPEARHRKQTRKRVGRDGSYGAPTISKIVPAHNFGKAEMCPFWLCQNWECRAVLIFNTKMRDYIISNGNEEEFIEMAEKLGYSELVFISNVKKEIKNPKIKISFAKNIFKSNISKDRNLIESKRAEMIYEFEQDLKKDKTHYRNSGLNHVLAELMNKKKVSYGLSFNQILNASKKGKAILFGRMMQNLILCRKYKVSVVVGSFARTPNEMRDFKDLISFSRTLGLNAYKP